MKKLEQTLQEYIRKIHRRSQGTEDIKVRTTYNKVAADLQAIHTQHLKDQIDGLTAKLADEN